MVHTDVTPLVKDEGASRERPARSPVFTRARLLSLMPIVAMVGLAAALTVANPRFIEPRSLVALADSAAPLAMLAAGATVVVMCGGIDLSIATLASLTSVLLALWVPALGLGAVPAVVGVAAVAGFVQGTIHVVFRIPSFIVTLGGMTVFSAAALVISGASTVPLVDTGATDWAFTRIGGQVPSSIVITLLAITVISLVMRMTPAGRWVAAIGYSEPAARLAGLPVAAVKLTAFTLSGACAGMAGVLLVARTFSGAPALADSLLLPAVAAIVVGGTAITGGHGGVWRTVAGALIVTMLRVGLSVVGVDSAYESILYGTIIIAAVALTMDRSKVSTVK